MSGLDMFRVETRDWLNENCPASMRTALPVEGSEADSHDADLWFERMTSKGWTCPTWPKEYGGAGLSDDEAVVVREELERIDARPAMANFGGTKMLGPVILEFGNEEQKQRFLPRIARGEIRWCQGYSEPGSGSDLAGLQTRAVLEGDEYVINGSKIWTSYADLSDWIFCLVRTDTDAPKHDGISFILFDMKTPGVEVRPIRLISGASPFCETFLTDVRVPRTNLIGTPNEGWTIAKRLLQFERSMSAEMGMNGAPSAAQTSMEDLAKAYRGETDGRIADLVLRDQILRHRMNVTALLTTTRRVEEERAMSDGPSATSSMFKYYGTERNKERYDLLLRIMGTNAFGWEGDEFSSDELNTTREWLRSRANSIEGGTSEVQLNVIAKRVLGLPD